MFDRRALSEDPAIIELAEKLAAGGAGSLSAAERRQAAKLLSGVRDEERTRGQYYDLYPEDGPHARRLYPKHMEHYRMGAHARERAIMGGNRTGKALPVWEVVPTPGGMRPIGELLVGDEVLGSDGRATRVTGVFPQGVREIYRVEATDGASVFCDGCHLWRVRKSGSMGGRGWRDRTTLSIAKSGRRYELPKRPVAVTEGPEPEVDGYFLGALLGDGSLGIETRVHLTTADLDILSRCASAALPFGCVPSELSSQNSGKARTYGFVKAGGPRQGSRKNPLIQALRRMGVMGVKSAGKRIPEHCMAAPLAYRQDLLRGLMDTDGTVDSNSHGRSFSTVSPWLAEGVQRLARSLGYSASIRRKKGCYRGKQHLSWRVNIYCGGPPVFWCGRKARKERETWREKRNIRLKNIEPAGEAECVCISVSNDDGLFLAGRGYVPTHNTVCNVYEACAHVSGRYPDWWEGRIFDQPVDALMAGKTNQTTRDIVQEKMLGKVIKTVEGKHRIMGGGIAPLDWIDPTTVTFRQGFPRLLDSVGIRYRDSRTEFSTVTFRAYEQGRPTFEGISRQYVGLDEECPEEIYGECLIRTGTVDGLVVLTFTPLDGMTQTVLRFISEEMRPPDTDSEAEDNFLEM